jgi:hypothetical protein
LVRFGSFVLDLIDLLFGVVTFIVISLIILYDGYWFDLGDLDIYFFSFKIEEVEGDVGKVEFFEGIVGLDCSEELEKALIG